MASNGIFRTRVGDFAVVPGNVDAYTSTRTEAGTFNRTLMAITLEQAV